MQFCSLFFIQIKLMPRRLALLIGVSEYSSDLPTLLAAINDVKAVKCILENPQLGYFDKVDSLINPNPSRMRRVIYEFFNCAEKDDLILLFFSGHALKDEDEKLYLANNKTSNSNFKLEAIPAAFVHERMRESRCRRQVIILDCCYSAAFKEGYLAKGGTSLIEKQLIKEKFGDEGIIVLASSSSTRQSFAPAGSELSLYTQYLVQGIETGEADLDKDSKIYIRELHKYVRERIEKVKPEMKPEVCLITKQGYDILIAEVSIKNRKIQNNQQQLLTEDLTKEKIHFGFTGNQLLDEPKSEQPQLNELLRKLRQEIEANSALLTPEKKAEVLEQLQTLILRINEQKQK